MRNHGAQAIPHRTTYTNNTHRPNHNKVAASWSNESVIWEWKFIKLLMEQNSQSLCILGQSPSGLSPSTACNIISSSVSIIVIPCCSWSVISDLWELRDTRNRSHSRMLQRLPYTKTFTTLHSQHTKNSLPSPGQILLFFNMKETSCCLLYNIMLSCALWTALFFVLISTNWQ